MPMEPAAVDDSVFDLRTANGQRAGLRAVLIRRDGQADTLQATSISWDDGDYLCLGFWIGAAPKVVYDSAQVFTRVPLQLRRVWWNSGSKL
jgi:hypothetical protein